MERIVIIGGNAAGLTAASRARRLDPRLSITVIEQAPFVSYSTCGIPYFIADEVSDRDLVRFTPGTLRQERNIEAHVEVRAEDILPSRKRVVARRVDTGEVLSFHFDRLLISTGVHPRPPDIPGTSKANVFSITTLEDAIRLRSALQSCKRIVIVGGGYVGLEMTESLRKLDKEVTLFERDGSVLASIDPDMARIIEYELRRHGVQLRTDAPVEAVVGEGDRASGVKARGVLGVQPADAVLMDTGVMPNVDLAERAGIRIGAVHGIAVNEYLETSIPGILAAGNCAEAFCLLRRRFVPRHLGTVAAKQGRVAGENLAGRRSKFSGSLGTTLLKVFDLAVGRTGLTSAEASSERIPIVSARIEALDRAAYLPNAGMLWIKLIAGRENGRVLGVQAAGYGDVSKRVDVAAAAISASMTLDDLAQLDLGYTPPYSNLWDPLQIAAQAALRKL